jgi:hypothetical protein
MFSQSRFEILALTDVEVIGPWPSLGVHLTGGVYLMGVYLMGVYLMGVYLMGMYVMGVYLTACISRVCTSWA